MGPRKHSKGKYMKYWSRKIEMEQEKKLPISQSLGKRIYLEEGNKMGRYYKKLFQRKCSSTLEYEFTKESQQNKM